MYAIRSYYAAQLPEAYITPVEWTEIIKRIQLHGIDYFFLNKDQKISVSTYKFSNIKWSAVPYENHHTVTFDLKEIEQQTTYPSGSVVIPVITSYSIHYTKLYD